MSEQGQTEQDAGTERAERDMKALAAAFEEFTRTTRTMEESYRRLEERLRGLDRELAEKNQELAVTSDYLNSILDCMSDGVIAVDSEGLVTMCNRAASAVLGYAADDVKGQRFRDVFGREPSVPFSSQKLMELRAKDGRMVTVSERDSPLSDRGGNRIGTVKVFQDLTELEDLRKQVRQKDRLAAIGEMAATVAHEIRNPLGGIRGFAALLARDLAGEEAQARLVEKILAGSEALERVVSELLEYTRPIELRMRRARCVDLVEAALGYVNVGDRTIRFVNEVAPDIEVMADTDRIRQVLLNILLNAVQSIEESGEVRALGGSDGKDVWIAIEDSGCGMVRDVLEHVFSPFFTTKQKGTGLGMAVAAKIVEVHGGAIEAESEPGRGSRFVVRLPGVGQN